MNAYEFIYSYIGYDGVFKEMYIEKEERILYIGTTGEEELINSYLSGFEQSLNSSLSIISPYYEIIY